MEQGQKIAAIDIGTNSVRMLVAEINSEGIPEGLYKETVTTRVGEGLAATGNLSEEAMLRTVAAVEKLRDKALEMGAQRVMCYATAAVRDAENQNDFIRLVHKKTQILVDVLPGEVEAQVSFSGAHELGPRCTMDIGGGSTDIVLGCDDVPMMSASTRLGAVRASELYPLGDIPDTLTLTAMRQWANNVIKNEIADLCESAASVENIRFYGVGGTCTTLAAMAQELTEYDSNLVHGYELSREKVEEILNRLSSLSLEERKQLPGLSANRADIIIGGTVILAAFMDQLNIKTITVSERDNLEGYILMRLNHEMNR